MKCLIQVGDLVYPSWGTKRLGIVVRVRMESKIADVRWWDWKIYEDFSLDDTWIQYSLSTISLIPATKPGGFR